MTTPLHDLKTKLEARFPSIQAKIDGPPHRRDGFWWLDLTKDGHDYHVDWSKEGGFGLYLTPETGYGSGPDETLTNPNAVFERLEKVISEAEPVPWGRP